MTTFKAAARLILVTVAVVSAAEAQNQTEANAVPSTPVENAVKKPLLPFLKLPAPPPRPSFSFASNPVGEFSQSGKQIASRGPWFFGTLAKKLGMHLCHDQQFVNGKAPSADATPGEISKKRKFVITFGHASDKPYAFH